MIHYTEYFLLPLIAAIKLKKSIPKNLRPKFFKLQW